MISEAEYFETEIIQDGKTLKEMLEEAEEDKRNGRYYTLDEVKQKLGIK